MALGSPPVAKDYRAALAARPSVPSVPAAIEVVYGEMHGMPAVIISDEDMEALAKPFELTLIGKFSVDRPSLAEIRKFIVRMKFFAFVKVDKHDMRNVVFRFLDERDYMRFFARGFYSIFGTEMRVTKWSPFSDVSEELPIVPLWVAFPGIRYQLFHLKTLMKVARVFGNPLCVDANTANQGSMFQARVLVEVDVSISHPDTVWIGSHGKGSAQPVIIENLPKFCGSCKKLGHDLEGCLGKGVPSTSGGIQLNQPIRQWIPKPKDPVMGSEGPSPASASGKGNHLVGPAVPNYLHYTSYAEWCQAKGGCENDKSKSSTSLTDIITEILGDKPINNDNSNLEVGKVNDTLLPSMVVSSNVLISNMLSPNVSQLPSNALPFEPVAGFDDAVICQPPSNSELIVNLVGDPDVGASMGATAAPRVLEGGEAPAALPNVVIGLEAESVLVQRNSGLTFPPSSDVGSQQSGSKNKVDSLFGPNPSLVVPFVDPAGSMVSEPEILGKHDYAVHNSETGSISGREQSIFDSAKGTPLSSPNSAIKVGRGKNMLFSNVLMLGAKPVSPSAPLSPRKTRLQSKNGSKGGDPDAWKLSNKSFGRGSGPRAVVFDALVNPQVSND